MRFKPSSHSSGSYGHDNADYYAQQMLTAYKPGSTFGDLGVYKSDAQAIEEAAAISAESNKKTSFFDTLTKLVQTGSAAVTLNKTGGVDPCKKPLGFALWGKQKKADWEAACVAYKAGAFVPAPVVEEAGTAPWVYGVGGLTIVGILGGVYFAMRDE